MIQTTGLTKRYGKLVALNNLHLNIEEGECFGYIGPNGAGKTTTIRILATLLDLVALGTIALALGLSTLLAQAHSFKLGDLSQVRLERPTFAVGDADVERTIEILRKREIPVAISIHVSPHQVGDGKLSGTLAQALPAALAV